MNKDVLLNAEKLTFEYGDKKALRNISFSLEQGRNLGILGESGSGKTTLLKLMVGLIKESSGIFEVNGSPIPTKKAELQQYHRHIQMIFQDPHTSIDPRQKIINVVAEPLHALKIGPSQNRSEWIRRTVTKTLQAVGLDSSSLEKRAREFSGGQRQRIAIARAIISQPQILLADEPVSALDLATKVRIIELLKSLSESKSMSIILVSHDMASIAALADDVIVMKDGEIVEFKTKEEILHNPQHPYTKKLIGSVLRLPSRA